MFLGVAATARDGETLSPNTPACECGGWSNVRTICGPMFAAQFDPFASGDISTQ